MVANKNFMAVEAIALAQGGIGSCGELLINGHTDSWTNLGIIDQ